MRARAVGHLDSQHGHKRLSSPISRFFMARSFSDRIGLSPYNQSHEKFLSQQDLVKGNGNNEAFFTVLCAQET